MWSLEAIGTINTISAKRVDSDKDAIALFTSPLKTDSERANEILSCPEDWPCTKAA